MKKVKLIFVVLVLMGCSTNKMQAQIKDAIVEIFTHHNHKVEESKSGKPYQHQSLAYSMDTEPFNQLYIKSEKPVSIQKLSYSI